MKISLNWVKEFTEIDLSADELVERIGAQLGAVDEVEDLSKKYKGLVIVEVLDCQKHPDADKLSICVVDDRGAVKGVERLNDGHVQIVCGAPNVKAGMLAVWIPPGAVVPSTFAKDPFKIDARQIRGVVSNGMMASPKELGLGDSHEGLLEIDEEIEPGSPFADAYRLNDFIIDIENKMFTHRPDCFGMLGVAREIAGIQARSFKSPDWYIENATLPPVKATSLKLSFVNEVPELASRFCLLPISDVKIGPSPVWLQARLASVGVRPINNVVDLTNYYMLETGQPLHAYDYDKLVKSQKSKVKSHAMIGVRLSKEGEEIKLLGGKNLKLQPGAMVITDGQKPIGLGGIMGGADTEVDETTKNIVLECANFDMNATRRSAMMHGLFTDAATRFTKNQSPLQNRTVIARAASDVIKIAGGGLAGELLDEHDGLPSPAKVSTTGGFINERLGLILKTEQIEKLLRNVEFKVIRQKDNLEITAPFWRTDIKIPEDIVEEVGRLYGYDQLPLELPTRDLSPTPKNLTLDLKNRLRSIMSAAGANEILTYSFVHSSLLDKVSQDGNSAYKIRNALSPDLQYYRLSLTPSLLDKVHSNIKLGYDKFVLFELGKVHNRLHPEDGSEKVPKEFDTLAAVYAAKNGAQPAFYEAKAFLDNLAKNLGFDFIYAPILETPDMPITKPYDLSRSAAVIVKQTESFVGIVGELRADVLVKLKLPKLCAAFEIGIDELMKGLPKTGSYLPLPKYPKVEQDITLAVPTVKNFAEVSSCLEEKLKKLQPPSSTAKLVPLGIYRKDENNTNYSFRLNISSYEKTLRAEEVNSLLDKIAAAAKKKINAERV